MSKRILGIVLASVLTTMGLSAMPQEPEHKETRVQKRKQNQQKRVAEGVENGSLTAKETAKIESKEAKLNKEIRKDRKDGKGLTPKERAKIEKKQDKISKEIYKEKHDGQTQK